MISSDLWMMMKEVLKSWRAYSLDLGVGRLPVKTAEEAMAVLQENQELQHRSTTWEDWRNNILFAADDEDGNLHMTQANSLADWVDENYPSLL